MKTLATFISILILMMYCTMCTPTPNAPKYAAEEQSVPVPVIEMERAVQLEEAGEAQEPELEYLGEYKITGYDPYCTHCCARADGITASGVTVTEGYTVAMCKDFPFGTKIYIERLGTFEVQDRGVGEGKVDIALGSHEECYKVTGEYKVWIIK